MILRPGQIARRLDDRARGSHEQALGILMKDMRQRGVSFEEPSDPYSDRSFIGLVSQVYDIGGPTNLPADDLTPRAA